MAVYSAAKGMTNFFIDEASISEDKSTADFYGSDFFVPNKYILCVLSLWLWTGFRQECNSGKL